MEQVNGCGWFASTTASPHQFLWTKLTHCRLSCRSSDLHAPRTWCNGPLRLCMFLTLMALFRWYQFRNHVFLGLLSHCVVVVIR